MGNTRKINISIDIDVAAAIDVLRTRHVSFNVSRICSDALREAVNACGMKVGVFSRAQLDDLQELDSELGREIRKLVQSINEKREAVKRQEPK